MSLRGRCYCGYTTVTASAPVVVAYCHCQDCKRWTGAPAPAFAAVETIETSPETQPVRYPSGVTRANCSKCGSPMWAQFPYLPGQTYIPLGILDEMSAHPPSLQCHAAHAVPWLHDLHTLPTHHASARAALKGASG